MLDVAVVRIQNTAAVVVVVVKAVVEIQLRDPNDFHQTEKTPAAEPVSIVPVAEDRFRQPV